MFNFPVSPPQASELSFWHDLVFYALSILTVLFTVLVITLVIVFAVRYRRGTKVNRERPVHENLKMELTWTFIPMLLGLGMFGIGTKLYVEMRTPPKDAMEIFVIGKQWMWHFQHSNGVRENNTLHVPVGKPVKLTMISQDVIHALYIPAFRAQFHVVPGRYTNTWFTPTKPGKYHIFCGIYCGTQHSEMGGTVVVMPQKDFGAWLENGGQDVVTMSIEQEGQHLYEKLRCNNCHIDKDTVEGPSLYGLWNKPRPLTNGSTVKADEAYIRNALLRPGHEILKGYGKEMPEYKDLSEEDILRLTAYLKTMGTSGAGTTGHTSPSAEGRTGREPAGKGNLSVGAIKHELGTEEE